VYEDRGPIIDARTSMDNALNVNVNTATGSSHVDIMLKEQRHLLVKEMARLELLQVFPGNLPNLSLNLLGAG
jgi:hypothetical protein